MSGLKLKINFGAKSGSISSPQTPGPLSTPTTATPGGTRTKLKITNNSTPSTPAPAPIEDVPKAKKTKAGRVPKASSKLIESKKRIKEESEDEGSTIQVIPHP